MNSVKFKIKGYDEISKSLIVSFASDTTVSQDPEDYTALAFQPLNMWLDVTDIEELKKCLGRVGMHHAQLQVKKEQLVTDPTYIAAITDLVGQTYEYPISDLVMTDPNGPGTTPFLSV